jgi:hypothetical protein
MLTRRVFDTVGKHYWVRRSCASVDDVSNLFPGFK